MSLTTIHVDENSVITVEHGAVKIVNVGAILTIGATPAARERIAAAFVSAANDARAEA